jgi:hypothetical protein
LYAGAYTKDYPGTRASPTIDGDRIYTFGGAGHTGRPRAGHRNEVWSLDVLKAAGSGENLTWGRVQPARPRRPRRRAGRQGGRAPSRRTRPTARSRGFAGEGRRRYAQVIAADVGGKPQLIAFGGTALFGLDPATGKTLCSSREDQLRRERRHPVSTAGQPADRQRYGVGGGMFKLTGAARRSGARRRSSSASSSRRSSTATAVPRQRGQAGILRRPTGRAAKCLGVEGVKVGFGGSFVRVGDKLIVQSQSGE